MQRDLLKSRFAKLPHLPPLDASGRELSEDAPQHDDRDDDDADEERDEFPASLPPPARFRPQLGGGRGKDYSPLTAAGYFASALEVDVPLSGPSHGQHATFRVYYTPPPSTASDGVVFVCVHGAGYSGLSWACFGKDLVQKGEGKAGVLAYDSRGHGKTKVSSESTPPLDMSLDALSADLVSLLKTMFPRKEDAPSFVLVGHSMGGAVVAEACERVQTEVGEVTGVAIVDVVEGTALEALEGMGSLVAAQPKGFASVEHAIEWHIRTKTINNLASARISVPPLIVNSTSPEDPSPAFPFVWRADLAATEPFWKGWFIGLSAKFLTRRTAKLLLLAGADRLDKELMIGQMQGKYQLEVYPDAGHCVQEDAPEKMADTLLGFWERNDRTGLDVLRGVKKVGEV